MRKRIFYPVSGLVLAAILIPYVIAALAGGDNFVFGGFLVNPLDGNSYLAKMEIGYQGDWVFRLPYTHNADAGGYLFLFYIFLGHAARVLGLPLIIVFHSARIFSAVFLLFGLRIFLTNFFSNRSNQIELAFIFTVTGAGLGWSAALMGGFTSDFWVAEAYPFLSMYVNPHFPLGLGLLVMFFTRLLDEASNKHLDLTLMLAGLLTAIIMPFDVVIAAVVGGLWVVIQWINKRPAHLLRLVSFLSLGGVFLLYQYWVTITDPFLAAWNAQNLTPSPALWDFAVSFFPLLGFAVFGVIKLIKKPKGPFVQLLIIWLIAGVLLIYLPVGLQRRFLAGYFIPVAGLAVTGIFSINRVKLRRLIVLLLIVFVPLTNLLIIGGGVLGAKSHSAALYITRDQESALKWIAEQTPRDAIVLASPQLSLYIPAHTGRRVVYGHPFETVQADGMKSDVEAFYRQDLREDSLSWLQKLQIDYIVYEEQIHDQEPLPFLDGVSPAYENNSVKIFPFGRNQ